MKRVERRVIAVVFALMLSTVAAAQTGFIEIRGTPGATVKLDGVQVAVGDPAEETVVLYDVPVGRRRVFVEKEGFVSAGAFVDVRPGEITVLEQVLRRVMGVIEFRCVPSDCVFDAPLLGLANRRITADDRTILFPHPIVIKGTLRRHDIEFPIDFFPCEGDQVIVLAQFGGATPGATTRFATDRSFPLCPRLSRTQAGSSESDVVNAVALGSEGTRRALVGGTTGSLFATNPGPARSRDPFQMLGAPTPGDDVIVRVIDGDTVAWERQFGTEFADFARAVAIGTDGRVVVAGYWAGTVGNRRSNGEAFVRVFDQAGGDVWERIFGTDGDEGARGVAIDPQGRIVVAGWTTGSLAGSAAGRNDAFVRVYTPDGEVAWERQFGTAGSDYFMAVTTDADGRIVLAGLTEGALFGSHGGGEDAMVLVLDRDGSQVWGWQSGAPGNDHAAGVAATREGAVAAGGSARATLGATAFGEADALVWRFAADGTPSAVHQFGSPGDDRVTALAFAPNGCLIATGSVAGSVFGVYGGTAQAFMVPRGDGFVHALASEGCEAWGAQIGSREVEQLNGLAISLDGRSVYAAGFTGGSLADVNLGGADLLDVTVVDPAPRR